MLAQVAAGRQGDFLQPESSSRQAGAGRRNLLALLAADGRRRFPARAGLERRADEVALVLREHLDLVSLPQLLDVMVVTGSELRVAHRLDDGLAHVLLGLDHPVGLSDEADDLVGTARVDRIADVTRLELERRPAPPARLPGRATALPAGWR